MPSTVQVDIHGQRYVVRSDLDPQYVSELASYVDEKMRTAAGEVTTADPLRIAVITAINLTDELYRLRSETAGTDVRARARFGEIERLVDEALAGARTKAVNE
jgi:cell division protein ZapA